ncbi:unnamed protein product, partial [Medioppia subpectinata]
MDVLSDRYKQSSVKHTKDVGDIQYQAPEGQTTEYNHLIDVYSLALIGAKIFGFDSDDIRDGVYIKLCDFGLAKSVDVLNDRYKQSSVKHTKDVGDIEYMAPEGQTTEYNHLIDVYSLALIGAKIFGFNTKDIQNGKYMAPEVETTEYNHLIDVYSLALIGAKIFGFDSDDIRDGMYILVTNSDILIQIVSQWQSKPTLRAPRLFVCLLAAILGYQLYDVSVDYFAYKTITVFDVMDNSLDTHLPHITLVYVSYALNEKGKDRRCLRSPESPQCAPVYNDCPLFNYTNFDAKAETRIAIDDNQWPGVDIRSMKRHIMYKFKPFRYIMVSLLSDRRWLAIGRVANNNVRQFAAIRRWSDALNADPKYVLLYYQSVVDFERLFSAEPRLSAVNHTLAVTQTMRRLLPSPYGRCSDYGSDPSTGAEGD